MNFKKLNESEEKRNEGWNRYNQNKLLGFGIVLFFGGLYLTPTIWTFKSQLSQIKGTLRSANTYVTTVTYTNPRNGYTTKSQKSELIFYLNERKQKFYLMENIGDKFRNEKYETILQGLKRADSIYVWVKKNAIEEYAPQVFQIDNDRVTLLDFETVRMDKSPLALFMLSMGLISIAGFFWFRYPDKFKKVTGLDELMS